MRQAEFFVILGHFLSFYPLIILKIKSFKKWKNAWRYYPFTNVYHKWRSYDISFLKYKVQQTEFFAILLIFSLSPPDNLENQNFEKLQKYLEIYYHFTHVTITWCMVSEILSMTDRIFSRLDRFLHFYPLWIQKIKILKNWKKMPGHIIILHICTINDNYMMCGSWDTECHRRNFLLFWTVFCPFTPPATQMLKKMKQKTGDIIILHKRTKNHDHMLHCSWYTTCDM